MCRPICWVIAGIIGVLVGYLSGLSTLMAVILAIVVFLILFWLLPKFICGDAEEISAAAAPAPRAAPKPAPAPAPKPAPAAAPAPAPAAAPAPAPAPAAAPEAAPQAPAAAEAAGHWSEAVAADSGKVGSGRGQSGLKPSAALAEEDALRDGVGGWKYESDAKPYRPSGGAPAAAPSSDGADTAPAPADAPAPTAESQPETLSAARGGVADDLKRIKGVGPGLEKTLNELGFYHFDQIAAWGEAEIAWVDARLKFKGRITRDDWIGQAKDFAQG